MAQQGRGKHAAVGSSGTHASPKHSIGGQRGAHSGQPGRAAQSQRYDYRQSYRTQQQQYQQRRNAGYGTGSGAYGASAGYGSAAAARGHGTGSSAPAGAPGAGSSNPYAASPEGSRYSRSNYGAAGRQLNIPQRKRRRKFPIIIGIIAALLLIAGAAAALYLFSIDNALSLGDNADDVNAALSEVGADQPYYVLLIGSDSRAGTTAASEQGNDNGTERSDIMVLTRVDLKTKTVTMVSVPRDTPYTNADGTIMKINEVYNQSGAAGTIGAVEQLTGVKISHYAEVHFDGFKDLVDAIGGITVNVPIDLGYTDALTGEAVTLEAGTQTLNGTQAEVLARARHEYGENQDENRQKAVRSIITAIVDKVLSLPVNELPGAVMGMAGCASTDYTSTELISLAMSFRGGMTMYSGTGPTEGAQDPYADNLWLCYEDPEGWKRLMEVVNSGEDPSGVGYKGDVCTIAGSNETVVYGG